MPRKPPPRRGIAPLGNIDGLLAETNRLAAAASTPTVETDTWGYPRRTAPRVESRPIPTVGFGHDPDISARARKARMTAASNKNPKSGKVRRN